MRFDNSSILHKKPPRNIQLRSVYNRFPPFLLNSVQSLIYGTSLSISPISQCCRPVINLRSNQNTHLNGGQFNANGLACKILRGRKFFGKLSFSKNQAIRRALFWHEGTKVSIAKTDKSVFLHFSDIAIIDYTRFA